MSMQTQSTPVTTIPRRFLRNIFFCSVIFQFGQGQMVSLWNKKNKIAQGEQTIDFFREKVREYFGY